MPAKYAHAKKRTNARRNERISGTGKTKNVKPSYDDYSFKHANPHMDKAISSTFNKTIKEVSRLERAIARVLLLRYEQDICRLYSARLHNIALIVLPKLIYDTIEITSSPGWVVANADCDEIKDFFRSAIAMDLRQAGERVATKSVLWSYTALRHFALSNNVHICPDRGLHSILLLPHFASLKNHLDHLESLPAPAFTRQTHLQSHDESLDLLADDIAPKVRSNSPTWDDWERKIRVGYMRLVDTLWSTAREFDVRGYGLVLREKLTTKWCDCGCSTDHLGEVCERTVREEEEESGIRSGKEREWDGRGSGVYAWMTEDEEDVWELDLDFGGVDPEESDGLDADMTIGELMEWRYFKAEKAKELGNKAFRNSDYATAIKQYSKAYEIEPEMPHYQLNIAAAHLKLQNWIAAEKACDAALLQHRSGKGYWRRAKARRMQGRIIEAVKDLRHVLKLQPGNAEALAELLSIMPSAATGLGVPVRDMVAANISCTTNGESGKRSASSSRGNHAKTQYGDDPPGATQRDIYPHTNGTGCASGSSSAWSSSASSASSSSSYSSSTACTSSSSHLKRPSSSSSAPSSSLRSSNAVANSKATNTDVSFELHEADKRKLRFTTLPIQVEMPVLPPSSTKSKNITNGNGKAKYASAGKDTAMGKSKGKVSINTSTNSEGKGKGGAAAYEMQIETYSYPAWERLKVQKVL